MSNFAVLDRFQQARTFFRGHCGHEMPEDLYDRQSWSMAGVHLMITESLLSVYRQAEGIRPADEVSFSFYALVTVSVIRIHHHTEEEKYLPSLEPEFKSPILDEHHLFTDRVHKLEEYLEELTGLHGDPVKGPIPVGSPGQQRPAYDGKRITTAIEAIAGPMLTHLQQEIGYLDGAKLRECGLPLSKLEAWEVYEQNMLRGFSPWVSLVFMVAHTPPNSRFPPLPPGMRKFFVPWVFWWKHRKAWRFCPRQEPLVSN